MGSTFAGFGKSWKNSFLRNKFNEGDFSQSCFQSFAPNIFQTNMSLFLHNFQLAIFLCLGEYSSNDAVSDGLPPRSIARFNAAQPAGAAPRVSGLFSCAIEADGAVGGNCRPNCRCYEFSTGYGDTALTTTPQLPSYDSRCSPTFLSKQAPCPPTSSTAPEAVSQATDWLAPLVGF